MTRYTGDIIAHAEDEVRTVANARDRAARVPRVEVLLAGIFEAMRDRHGATRAVVSTLNDILTEQRETVKRIDSLCNSAEAADAQRNIIIKHLSEIRDNTDASLGQIVRLLPDLAERDDLFERGAEYGNDGEHTVLSSIRSSLQEIARNTAAGADEGSHVHTTVESIRQHLTGKMNPDAMERRAAPVGIGGQNLIATPAQIVALEARQKDPARGHVSCHHSGVGVLMTPMPHGWVCPECSIVRPYPLHDLVGLPNEKGIAEDLAEARASIDRSPPADMRERAFAGSADASLSAMIGRQTGTARSGVEAQMPTPRADQKIKERLDYWQARLEDHSSRNHESPYAEGARDAYRRALKILEGGE